MLKNSTFEIENGYIFSNTKAGNYYEATKQVMNKKAEALEEYFDLGVISIIVDADSTHLESSVNHILDVIGTIGGSFELVHYFLLIIYLTIRKNLYFYTIIKRINEFQRSQNTLNVKVYPNTIRTSQLPWTS